jgi:hypothetical protein
MYKQVMAFECKCDLAKCGHRWISEAKPVRCAKCKSRIWNCDSVASGVPASGVVESVVVESKLTKAKTWKPCPTHKTEGGFARSDGWWCAKCVKMYREEGP